MGPAFVFRNQVRICSYHWNVLSQSTWTYLNPFNDIEAFFTTRVCIPQCVLTFPVGAPWSAFLRLAHFSLELCGLVCCLLSMMIRHAQHRRKSNLSLWGPVSAGLLDWNGLKWIEHDSTELYITWHIWRFYHSIPQWFLYKMVVHDHLLATKWLNK